VEKITEKLVMSTEEGSLCNATNFERVVGEKESSIAEMYTSFDIERWYSKGLRCNAPIE
tara:strand:- start:51 stop:227 length:177 start_codon:yes stop_codon:yes gene_type:complete